MKPCCNHVVGVLIHDGDGRLLMFQRNTPPVGVAPVAGHVDDHGNPEDAAVAEVREEVGLTVTRLWPLLSRWLPNVCRRPSPAGIGHHWTVYRADTDGHVYADPREARHPRWYTPAEVQALADRTVEHARGRVTAAQFAVNPGLEPVWVLHLHDLGQVAVSDDDVALVGQLAAGAAVAGT